LTDQRKTWLGRLLGPPLIVIGAVLFLFEEFLWTGFIRWLGRLSHLRLVARFEDWAGSLPPYPAMALFIVPLAAIVPVKLVALWLIGTHHVVLGVALLVAAKLIATALEARLFAICKPALLSVGWFHRLHDWVLDLRARLYTRLEAMPGWQAARRRAARLKALLHDAAAGVRAALARSWRRLRGV
jgi:hypothetical protein